MGGSGGSGIGYTRQALEAMRQAMDQTVAQEERKRVDADVNRLLQDLLVKFNAIDRESIRERLLEIDEAMGDAIEFNQFLYAGSVAKHTAIDGLSDVDALMAFSSEDVGDQTPQAIRERCRRILIQRLDARSLAAVTIGQMAVTVRYRDGMEIQLLPAVRTGDSVAVPTRDGRGWIQTHPLAFREQLTRANESLGGRLVPGVKLFKSAISGLPEKQQISGYHAEALAVEAARSFPVDQPRTLKAIVSHIVHAASTRVLRPMQDVTGQSNAVDQDLGPEGSTSRRLGPV